MVLGFFGSIASKLLPSLFSGGVAKTIGDIGKSLILPIGSKLLGAAGDALSNILGTGEKKEINITDRLKEGAMEGLSAGYNRAKEIYNENRAQVTGIQENSDDLEGARRIPVKRRRRPRKEKVYEETEEPRKAVKPNYESNEEIIGSSEMYGNKRDYEA